MKYQQPYGISDPNAAYINGNPSTGTMGSIPPAASIEHPQREIANFISDSGATPTDADLRQLSKSVQSGKVNYATDAGTPNFIAITPTPAVAAYALGLRFAIKAAADNTGPTKLNVNAVGWQNIVRGDKTPINAGEILAGMIFEVAWDGTAWQMLAGVGGLIQMTEPRSLYLNNTTGSDTLYDGTQATVDAPNGHGPFKTLKHALDVMLTYNLGGWTFTISCADGTYTTTSVVTLPTPNGSGQIQIIGNVANPSAVKFINSGTGSTLSCGGGNYYFNGIYVQSTVVAPNDFGSCVNVSGAGAVWLAAVNFGGADPSVGSHIAVGPSGTIGVGGPIGISGNAGSHIAVYQNGTLQTLASPAPTLSIFNSVTLGSFIIAMGCGQAVVHYASIASPGLVTGQKYSASGNGVINSQGSGASYFPGTIAGAVSSGGQYL